MVRESLERPRLVMTEQAPLVTLNANALLAATSWALRPPELELQPSLLMASAKLALLTAPVLQVQLLVPVACARRAHMLLPLTTPTP